MKLKAEGQSLWREFKGFALKGNVVDLAVAVVIGGAFGTVVNSLVKNVIMPLVEYVLPSKGGYVNWHIGTIKIGAFLADVLNFVIISFAMYLVLVKFLQLLRKASILPAAGEPQNKICPFCLSSIPFKAVKCAHCTADLSAAKAPEKIEE